MARHSNHALKENARRGAIRTWCPSCKRKSALSAVRGNWTHPYRVCRYCEHEVGAGGPESAERQCQYEQWAATMEPA